MNIIEVNKKNSRKAGEILAIAFKDDPIFKYIFKSQEKYDRCAAWLFSTWVRWAVMFGKAWMTDDESAVIIMRGIGKSEMSLWSMIRAGMLPTPFRLGLRTFKRFYFEIVNTLDKEHAKVMGNTPHWYGWMVGVKPEYKRVGWKLINHCIDIADRSNLPLFLETSTARNVSLYNHKEFQVKGEKFFKAGNFTLYFMVREPNSNQRITNRLRINE